MAAEFRLLDPFVRVPDVIEPVFNAALTLRPYRPKTRKQFDECLHLAREWVASRCALNDEERDVIESLYARLFIDEPEDVRRSLKLVGKYGEYGQRDVLCVLAYTHLDTVAVAHAERRAGDVLWAAWAVHEAIAALKEADRGLAASERARHAANSGHVRNRSSKQRALEHYAANRSKFRSKNDAAAAIAGHVVAASYEAVRKWLRGQ